MTGMALGILEEIFTRVRRGGKVSPAEGAT